MTIGIARSRKLIPIVIEDSAMLENSGILPLKNAVRFSLVVDISEAAFKYDMRRLQEILAFPKAWYRRTIMRQLLFGAESAVDGATAESFECSALHAPDKRAEGSSTLLSGSISQEQSKLGHNSSVVSDTTGKGSQMSISDEDRVLRRKSNNDQTSFGRLTSDTKENFRWDAVVVFAVNFSQLDIETNMGSTMGNTKWITEAASSQGHMAIDNFGNKNMLVSFKLGSSRLESRSGMIGGLAALSGLRLLGQWKEGIKKVPSHELYAWLNSSETRIEYMGTTNFIGSITGLHGKLYDLWLIGEKIGDTTVDTLTLDIIGKINWDQLYIMITRSTVAELFKINYRLHEFFDKELITGKRAFELATSKISEGDTFETSESTEDDLSTEKDANQSLTEIFILYLHWAKALEMLSTLPINFKKWPMPNSTAIKGTLECCGNEIALACFYGSNFRADRWALFHMQTPGISFNVEAKDIVIGVSVNSALIFIFSMFVTVCVCIRMAGIR